MSNDELTKDSVEIKLERSDADSIQPQDEVQSFEEKRLVRKLDNRILPIACLLYLFACEYAGKLGP